jgi:EAL domain-containing protein (putative c-di-GMP-specific phosphodiesterase class I)
MEFREWVEENRQSLPFDERYITQIIKEMEDYKKSFEITLNVSKKPEITKKVFLFRVAFYHGLHSRISCVT